MAKIFSVVLNSGPGYGPTRHAERAEIARLLLEIAEKICDGTTKDGEVFDRAYNVAGHFSYSPVVAS